MSTSVLTFALRSLILNSPNQVSRNRRLSALPKSDEVLSAHSAIFRVPSGIVSGGRRVSIGRPATSSIREDWRLCVSRGALWCAVKPQRGETLSKTRLMLEAAYNITNIILSYNKRL